MSYPVRKNLKNRRAVILGGTLAGISAALSLSARGARVVVLEASDRALRDFREVTLGDATFDLGPATINSPAILAEIFTSLGHRLTDFLSLRRSEPVVRCHFDDGDVLDFHGDEAQTSADCERFGEGTGAALSALMLRASKRQRAVEAYLRNRAAWNLRSLFRPDPYRSLALAFPRGYDGAILNRAIRSEKLRDALYAQRVLSGISPSQARGGFFLASLQAGIAQGGWRIEGGGPALREALLRLCEVRGVKILTGVRVERIELRSGAVRTVTGVGFKPITTSIVVGTDAPDAVLRELLPPEGPWIPALGRIQRHSPPRYSRFLWLAATRNHPEAYREINMLVSPSPMEETRALDQWQVPASQPSLLVTVDKGTSGSLLKVSAVVPSASRRYLWTDERRMEYRDVVLKRLKTCGFKGIEKVLLDDHAVGPAGVGGQRLLGYHIADFSAPHSMAQVRGLHGNRVNEIPGLYLAGPLTHPGGGFAQELLSGLRCAVLASNDALR